jgi:hypothetical protein
MTSATMETIEQVLLDANLTDGYEFKWYRWHDDDLKDKRTRLVTLRPESGGVADNLIGHPDYRIILIGQANDPVEPHDRAEAIKEHLLSLGAVDKIMQFQILADILGPSYLEDDRPVFELNIRVLQSRSD